MTERSACDKPPRCHRCKGSGRDPSTEHSSRAPCSECDGSGEAEHCSFCPHYEWLHTLDGACEYCGCWSGRVPPSAGSMADKAARIARMKRQIMEDLPSVRIVQQQVAPGDSCNSGTPRLLGLEAVERTAPAVPASPQRDAKPTSDTRGTA